MMLANLFSWPLWVHCILVPTSIAIYILMAVLQKRYDCLPRSELPYIGTFSRADIIGWAIFMALFLSDLTKGVNIGEIGVIFFYYYLTKESIKAYLRIREKKCTQSQPGDSSLSESPDLSTREEGPR